MAALNAAGAEYLVVGAHALAAHGHPRASKDLDVWVRATAANAERAYRALAAFGAPLDLHVDDLSSVGTAWPDRVSADYGGQVVDVISRQHLIQNKKAAGRPPDVVDVALLEGGEPATPLKTRRPPSRRT